MLLGPAVTGKHFTDGHTAPCPGLRMQHAALLRTEVRNPIHLKAIALKFLEPGRSIFRNILKRVDGNHVGTLHGWHPNSM